MKRAKKIQLSNDELKKLQMIKDSAKSEIRYVMRATIILSAAEGKSTKETAKEMKKSRQTVALWRNRFAAMRMDALQDAKGRGRKRKYKPEKIETLIERTITASPNNATHWSTRSMAKELGLSHMTVQRIWKAHQLKPHLIKTFKLSKDKNFIEKLRDVVGLYVNPPEHSIVFCIDEKSQIQALDRTQPGLPLKKGKCGTMTHDYKRHGTTTLFAALNMLDGTVMGECMNRHRHQEYLKFLKLLDKKYSHDQSLELHLIADNYSTHKHIKVKYWLKRHPHIHIHFIPTSCSWLNLVERFFSELTMKRIRRGVFRSVLELVNAIDEYLENHNAEPKPFIWTKTADEIITKLKSLYANNK